MNIGLIHFRVGDIDGVSLEMEKWLDVLKRMHFKAYLIAGETGSAVGFKIPSIAYLDKRNNIIKQKSFVSLGDWTEERLINEINKQISIIYNELEQMIDLDILLVNNIFSLAHNPAAAVAIYRYCKYNGIEMIGVHHDFYWERDFYMHPTSKYIEKILELYFPPMDITHIVINSFAQEKLRMKKGIESYVVPNVFDFNQPPWQLDDYNIKLYDKLNISKNDIIFLQATRLVKRKAVELAIDTISIVQNKLKDYLGNITYNGKKITKDTKIVLLLPGLPEEADYVESITKYAKEKNVNLKPAFSISNDIRHEEQEIFSLWDFYAIADFIAYPSVIEGFGNQLLEAIFSKKPIMMFEYPVYKKDIAPFGFDIVSLGSSFKQDNGFFKLSQDELNRAAEQVLNILFDFKKASSMVRKNFDLGKKYFSYNTLEKKLKKIFIDEGLISK